MQCNVEFGYQLSICSGIEGNHGKNGSSRERERCRKKNNRRVGERKKVLGRSERHFIVGREKEHHL
jgi:hypothetical protein